MMVPVLARLALAPALLAPVHAAQAPVQLPVPVSEEGAAVGESVAVSGSRIVVGAPYEDAVATNSGAAYVFVETAGGWQLEARLTASDGAAVDRFGSAVAIDGERIVVGAWGCDGANTDEGAAYVFERVGTSWIQAQKLVASDPATTAWVGYSVAVDGDTVVVGGWAAPLGTSKPGAAYVFERQPGGWTVGQKLVANDAAHGAAFGSSVAASGDRVLVGAPNDSAVQSNAGAAYVFERSGTAWSQSQKLVASDANTGARLGQACDVDGERILVGAFGDGSNGVYNAEIGAAYFFELSGTWTEVAKVRPAEITTGERFGFSVALAGDDAVAGAPRDALGWGTVYVYRRTSSGWQQIGAVNAPGAEPRDELGYSVALDPPLVVAGARKDDAPDEDCGSAWLLRRALSGDVDQVSVGGGGAQTLALDAGLASAGLVYLVLGSATGTEPGFPVGADVLPLAIDVYLLFTLANPNVPPLSGSLGMLDASGRASATFALPPGVGASLVGTELNHAAVVLDVLAPAVVAVTNPVPVQLVP